MVKNGKIDFSGGMPAAPKTMAEILGAYDAMTKANMELIKSMSEEEYNSTMGWHTAPKQEVQLRKADILWVTLMDMVHHRGQFSVYLRIAGAKVPSIYGPTADEPWM